jgi:hemerythrin
MNTSAPLDLGPASSWQPQLSVAVAALDAQHHHIFQLLARSRADAFGGQPKAQLSAGLDELIGCLQSHFAGEELLMRTFNYPDSLDHQQQHQRLTRVLVEFQEQFGRGDESLALALLDYLEGWLVHHILERDRSYSSFFAERGAVP